MVSFHFYFFEPKIKAQNNIDTLIQYLLSNVSEIPILNCNYCNQKKTIISFKILSYGNEALPYLIEVIDVDNQYVVYYGELSSILYSDYYGIVFVK